MDYSSLEARDSKKLKDAVERLQQRIRLGAASQQAVLERAAKTIIKDRLVPPKAFTFFTQSIGVVKGAYLGTGPQGADDLADVVAIHPHALRQMAAVAGMPGSYVTKLQNRSHDEKDTWPTDLACHNLNELFTKGTFKTRRGEPARYLHRVVNGEVRGFLSRIFNRKLGTLNLLRPFIERCQTYQAGPVEASTTDTRASLKYMLPHVFEPVDGEFVAIGVTYSNSDFGDGSRSIASTFMRISAGTIGLVESSTRRHIGSIITDDELEVSDEAQDKELEAQQLVVRDLVDKHLKPESVERILTAIRVAHEQELPWHRLEVLLNKVLQKKEVQDVRTMLSNNASDIIDLPPVRQDGQGDPIASAWWAANVLGIMASKTEDASKRAELQGLAGSLVMK